MKTKVKTNKMPRTRVLFGTAREYRQTSTHLFQEKSVDHYDVPCLVLPQPSLSAAKKALKWAKLGEAQKGAAIYKVLVGLTRGELTRAESVDAILKLTEQGTK